MLIHRRAPGGGGYGQNIAAGISAGELAKTLTNGFYNDEMMLYPGYGTDSPDMGNFEKWGHFSQMLWQTTTKVGCYTYTCSPPGAPPLDCNPATGQSYLQNTGCGNGGMNAIFTVCNYSPPGNYPFLPIDGVYKADDTRRQLCRSILQSRRARKQGYGRRRSQRRHRHVKNSHAL